VAHAKGTVFEVKQPKPLGVEFKDSPDGIVVSKVNKDADERIQVGDKLLAVSASFGGEIWPAKSYPQSMMAINTRIGQVYLKLESVGGKQRKGLFGNENVGPSQEYVCLDCGWVYLENKRSGPFDELPKDFICPQCQAGKRRFAKKDMATGKLENKALDFAQIGQYATVVGGLVGVGVLFKLGLDLSK